MELKKGLGVELLGVQPIGLLPHLPQLSDTSLSEEPRSADGPLWDSACNRQRTADTATDDRPPVFKPFNTRCVYETIEQFLSLLGIRFLEVDNILLSLR